MSEQDRDTTLLMMDESMRGRLVRIARGLRAPKDSGEFRYAKFEVIRMSSSWGVSLGISVLLVVGLLVFAVGGALTKDSAVEVVVMTPENVKLDEIKEEIKRVDEPPPDADNNSMDAPTIGDASAVDIPGPKTADATPATTTPIMSKSPLIMKGLAGSMANRGAGARSGALRSYGGTGRGEEAVMRALRWLKKNQGADGSWAAVDPTDPAAMAGLALLCFLAHNETPASEEFGQTVEKAMKYIVSKQNGAGSFGRDYTHGICTYALAEGYALTKIMALKDSVEKGMAFIINGQQPLGGFNYGYEKGARWDMSVAGWQFQAMKAAKMTGLADDKLNNAITNGIEFIRKQAFCATAGGFGYSGVPGTPGASASQSMTGAGTLCLQLLGQPNVPEVRAGLEYLKAVTCEWPAGGGKVPMYGWYYITQAKFQKGGKDWDTWNAQFSKALIGAQAKDGHWDGGDHGGPVYSTTICCLMLEVYYRYLPTYKHSEEVVEVKPTATDDVVVDVR